MSINTLPSHSFTQKPPHPHIMTMRVRGYLTEKSVLEIFALRPRRSLVTGATPPNPVKSRMLASQYNVSNKTVRDIWNRNSWSKLTEPFCDGGSAVTAPSEALPSTSDPAVVAGVPLDVSSDIDADISSEIDEDLP
eukprot:2632963-Rhodomonas_salina.1